MDSFYIDATFRMYGVPILSPRPTGAEKREWFACVLTAFIKHVDEHGFSLVG